MVHRLMTDIELKKLFEEYQKFTPTTAQYPKDQELLYLCLGLLGERIEWYESGYDIKEAGDIFWYCSQLCNYFYWDLWQIFEKSNATEIYIDKYNLPEELKKYIRDKKVPTYILDVIEGVLSSIKYRYTYFNSPYSLEETTKLVLITNRDKLIDRQNRNVIKGSGDNR